MTVNSKKQKHKSNFNNESVCINQKKTKKSTYDHTWTNEEERLPWNKYQSIYDREWSEILKKLLKIVLYF